MPRKKKETTMPQAEADKELAAAKERDMGQKSNSQEVK